MFGLTLYALLKLIVRMASLCTFYLILSYVRPLGCTLQKKYRTSDLSDVRFKKNIVRLTPQMYALLKFIVLLTPRTYTSKSFSVCFSRKIYALILFISRQNFRRALETVLYLPIGGQIPIFGYCHCYIYRLFLHLS